MGNAKEIIDFWFSETSQKLWFNSTNDFDREIQDRFEITYEDAKNGLLQDWEATPEGSLALVILFDQFPLNMYRGDKKSFETESLSREVASRSIEKFQDQVLPLSKRAFLYIPFMHSENIADQDRSVVLFKASDLKENLRFAEHHRKIIQDYGRFPHRNSILGRKNTPEEEIYLNSGKAFFG